MIKQNITNTFYFNSNRDKIINESDIDDVFESIDTAIISNIWKSLGKGSGWIIDSVIDHNIKKYNPLIDSHYSKLPKEFDKLQKLIKILQENLILTT